MKSRFFKVLAGSVLIGIFLYASSADCFAQNDRGYVFPQNVRPVEIDNYAFTGYYFNGRQVYNLRQSRISKSKGNIVSMKINPSGTSYAVISRKDAVVSLKVYDLWKADAVMYEFDTELSVPNAICYSPDSKSLAVAYDDRTVQLYDTRTYRQKERYVLPFIVDKIAISDNNYFMAAVSRGNLRVYNLDNGMLRYETQMMSSINAVAFSSGSDYMITCTENGLVQLFDTKSFQKVDEFDSMGTAVDCAFHPDNKYIAVVMNDKSIVLINRYDQLDREYVRNSEGGISDLCFVKDGDDNVYLLYNTTSSMTYHYAGGLSPNYTLLLSDELDNRMQSWMKRMDGETMEEYNLRVNEDSRKSQMLLYEMEIATELAGNLLEMSTVSLGGYNQEAKTLALNFDTMPTIYLGVSENKVGDFADVEKLDFRNAKYGLTSDDKFELVYVEIYNMETGSLAVYDNRDRRELSFLFDDTTFIPLEVVQVSNMDAVRLENIKDEVVTVAKAGNIISDHTEISVSTNVYSSVDAAGNDILNYRVGFSYNVEAAFSAVEDFAPGKYHTDESGAAMSMIEIIGKAFETDFAQYVKSGKKVKVKVTGMADQLRITGVIPYDASYGNYINEPVYGDELFALSVTRQTGITTNEQLAFVRAAGVKAHLESAVLPLSEMNSEFEYHIQVMDKVGGEYRRISVEFDFIDVF